jgi:hypothetical protein
LQIFHGSIVEVACAGNLRDRSCVFRRHLGTDSEITRARIPV